MAWLSWGLKRITAHTLEFFRSLRYYRVPVSGGVFGSPKKINSSSVFFFRISWETANQPGGLRLPL